MIILFWKNYNEHQKCFGAASVPVKTGKHWQFREDLESTEHNKKMLDHNQALLK